MGNKLTGCPCKGCAERKPATQDAPSCHASCDRYKVFDAYRKDIRRKRQDAAKEDMMYFDHLFETVNRHKNHRIGKRKSI